MNILNSASNSYTAITIANEQVYLLPEKALYWPKQNTLYIADPHFGKEATFRASAVPIPEGITQYDLMRIDQLLQVTHAKKIVFLGDFFHAYSSQHVSILAALLSWRQSHAALDLILVRGNHDDHAGDPPRELNISCVDEPFLQSPFVCTHHPQSSLLGYVLAGHVHPVKKIYGQGKQVLRLPCFYITQHYAILPAFGSFTGGYNIEPEKSSTIYLMVEQQIIPMSF